METKGKKWRAVSAALFACYGALMLYLLFGRPGGVEGIPYWEQVGAAVNFVPFRTIRDFWAVAQAGEGGYWTRFAIVNLAGNVVMFVPLGFFLPCLWRKARRLGWTLLVSAAVILAVEIAQPLTLRGSGDIDDLILNLIGVAIGYALFAIVRRRTRREDREGL